MFNHHVNVDYNYFPNRIPISVNTCGAPTVSQGTLEPNTTTVNYDETYTVTCNVGYTVANSVMTCGADGTFDVTATCTGR